MNAFLTNTTDRVFAHALNTVKRIPRTGSARPPPVARLKLYGLYKQSMEGDVEGVMRRPPDDAPDTEESKAERDKWDAWHQNAGLSRTAAKRAYITTLIETMHEYASSTAEARELVAELEFVWDQIKANSNNTSTESSPRGVVEDNMGMSYASLGGSRRAVDDEGGNIMGGLRRLRPVSEGDDEDYDDDDDDEDAGEGNGVTQSMGRYLEPMDASRTIGGSKTRDLDVRNRKWRKRIETALFKMATEVAALREQIENRQMGDIHHRGSRAWAWLRWLVWVIIRQLLTDAALLGLAFLLARKKGKQGMEQGLRLILRTMREQLRQQFPMIKMLGIY
ncbi:MAG: hypothetical protein Q9220_003024 [cf. Caloplaca sp. 1 TL-2023]